jgi:hypothetical protein
MPLENANNLMELNPLWPVGDTDNVDEGDDHIRQMKNVLQLIFPVGAIYTTKAQAIDPNVFIGGTWLLLPEGRVLRGATAGESGGEEAGGDTVLATANLPSHAHSAGTLSAVPVAAAGPIGVQGQIQFGNGAATGTRPVVETGDGYRDGNTTGAMAEHGHAIGGNTDVVGDGDAFEAVPAYVAVYHWERTA